MHKTINLLPANTTREERYEALPSVIATMALMLAIGGIGFIAVRKSGPVHVAFASTEAAPARSVCEVSADEPLAIALLCAEGWVPWYQLLAELPPIMGPIGQITAMRFRAATNQLEISGDMEEVQSVPELMLFFEQRSWLKRPVPVTVNRDRRTGRPSFTIRVDVVPPLKLEVLR